MRTSLAFLLLLFAAVFAFPQTGNGGSNYNAGVQYVVAAPSGSCVSTAIAQIVMSSGTMYTCQSGTWGAVGGGTGPVQSVFGRTGAITAGAADYSSVPGLSLGDGTGNNIFFGDSAPTAGIEILDQNDNGLGIATSGIPNGFFLSADGGAYVNTDSTGTDVVVASGTAGYIELGNISAPTPGLLRIVGSSSGYVTVTPPAIAGTTTNPLVVSNTVQAPDLNTTTGGAGSVFGSAMGGAQGAGTLNATGLYVNGSPVVPGSVPWSGLTAASAGLTLANGTNATTFDQTANTNWTWANTTAGTSGTTNASPVHNLVANYWTGSASAADTWTMGTSLAAGTNGVSNLNFAHSGTSGAVSVVFPNATISPSAYTATDFSIGANVIAITNVNHIGAAALSSGYPFVVGGFASTLPYGVLLGNITSFTNPTQTLIGAQYGVALGNPSLVTAQGSLTFAPTSGAVKIVGAGVNAVVDETSTNTSNYTGLQVNVGETAFLGSTALLLDLQVSCPITNVVETSGSVVTLTVVNNKAAVGQVVFLEGLTTATWLNGYAVTLSSGSTSTSLVFTDPTSHGTQTSHAEIGRASLDTFTINTAGAISSYQSTATVRKGIAAEYYSSDLTAQAAAITATNLVASAPQTGVYRISWSATITTADSVSSVLGGANGFQVTYTSPTDSVAKTTVAGASVTSSANTTGTATSGVLVVYAKTNTAISYTFGYTAASNMVYELHISVEAL